MKLWGIIRKKLNTPILYNRYRKDTGTPNNHRRISEQLLKYNHLTIAYPTRPTCPTCLTCPTRPTRPTCPTCLTNAGAAHTPTCPTCLTRPTCLTCLTRPIIAGAACTPTYLYIILSILFYSIKSYFSCMLARHISPFEGGRGDVNTPVCPSPPSPLSLPKPPSPPQSPVRLALPLF